MVAARCTLLTRTAISSRFSMNLPSAPNALVEAEKEAARQFSLLRRVAAWAVHAYTASGVVAGFLALRGALHWRRRRPVLLALVWRVIDIISSTPGPDGHDL